MRRDFHEHMDMFSRQNAGYDLYAQFFAHLPDNRSYPIPQRANRIGVSAPTEITP
jgi:hypothetical protein